MADWKAALRGLFIGERKTEPAPETSQVAPESTAVAPVPPAGISRYFSELEALHALAKSSGDGSAVAERKRELFNSVFLLVEQNANGPDEAGKEAQEWQGLGPLIGAVINSDAEESQSTASVTYERVWDHEQSFYVHAYFVRWDDPTHFVRCCRDRWPEVAAGVQSAVTVFQAMLGPESGGFRWISHVCEPGKFMTSGLRAYYVNRARIGDAEALAVAARACGWFLLGNEDVERLQMLMATSYRDGRGVPVDWEEMAFWYGKAAERGVPAAQVQLGECYRTGHGVAQDEQLAVQWFRSAADLGNERAQCLLGQMYASGLGVPHDLEQAGKWFLMAAEQGDATAQFNLGVMYASGQGGAQDDAQGVAWYRKAAEQGLANAEFSLGMMYRNGQGVPQGDVQAAEWIRKAAEQGHAAAQCNLGVMYANGQGVAQDYPQAVAWYRKAAEQGLADAQNSLGARYETGQGVARDYAQAVAWYRKAAEQGHAAAQHNLGVMYANGRGVPPDDVSAYFWVNLASLASDDAVGERARDLRETIAKRMTPAQIAEVQSQSREQFDAFQRLGAKSEVSAADAERPADTDSTSDASPGLSDDGLDVGQQALRQVFLRMNIDEEWSVCEARRFVWWVKDFAQEITVSEPTSSQGIWIARLRAKTTIATDVALDDAAYQRLSSANALGATLSALVYEDDGTLGLVTSAVVHRDTLWFVPDHFALAAAMQAADAQIKAWVLTEFIGGQVATSSHPSSGVRDQMDDLGNIIASLVAPKGQEPSQWAGAEMEEALGFLQNVSVLATGGSTGVTAEFPFGKLTSLLRMDTTVPHPQVGSGLHVTLRLPFGPSEEAPAVSVAILNRLESYGAGALDLQGTWCVAPGNSSDLTFTAFYPNVFARKGIGALIALKMARRAEWAAGFTDGMTRERRWLLAQPAFKRLIETNSDAKVLQCESCNQVVIILSDLRCPNCGSDVRLPN